MKDFYAVLGVTETANETEIKRAYRELARRYHPDVADSPEAETKFKEINEAYNVLSNSLKRADYDQTRRPKNAPEGSSPKEFRRLVTEALGRVLVYAGVFGLIGASIDLVLLWLGESDMISFVGIIGGLSAGILTGIIWGIDQNFVVETFLGESRVGRTYTFMRTVILALSGAYFLGRIVAFGEINVGAGTVGVSTLIASTIGLVIGATFGSDGETWHKLFNGTGRVELFYTMLRGLMVGAIATLITGAVIGMFHLFGVPLSDELWILFIGFALGMIVGAMRPANLSAYASYASASIRTTLFALIILGTLIIGVTLGIIGRDFFSGYL